MIMRFKEKMIFCANQLHCFSMFWVLYKSFHFEDLNIFNTYFQEMRKEENKISDDDNEDSKGSIEQVFVKY